MLSNYLKIAWRTLLRNPTFSAINIVGLAIGLATCLVISLFVFDELSYDRFNEKADRIVRVTFRGTMNGGKINEANVMPPVARTLKAQFPEVLDATRLREGGSRLFTYKNQIIRQEAVAFVDANFFNVFSLPFRKGNPQTALIQPNTAVMTEATARRYFGDQDPIGKVLTIKGESMAYTITGIMDPMPANAHFGFDFLVSLAGTPDADSPSWMQSNYYTYLVLPEGYDYKRLEAKLPQLVLSQMGPQIQQSFGMSMVQFRQKGNDVGLFLQPLTDIHLHSNFAFDLSPVGDIRYVYIFGVIALFMLLIACINFMNLSTAGASKRAREVGIRKVMGSPQTRLVSQFLVESVLLTTVALLLAIGLVYLMLPFFNELAGKTLTFSLLKKPWLLPVLVGVGLVTGLIAGSYPAFFLSSFKPVAVLKGGLTQRRAGRSGTGLRSGLVVFQFCMSIGLSISTTIVYQQLRYIQTRKVGYDRDQVLVLREAWRLGNREATVRNEWLRDSRVANASISGYLPAGPTNSNNFIVYADNNESQLVKTLCYEVDDRYLSTLGMRIVAGRNFSSAFSTDSLGILLNETAVKTFGWDRNAIGHTLTRSDNNGQKRTYRVIGIIQDFHFKSMHERISPLLMTLNRNDGFLIIKTKTQHIAGLVDDLKKQWTGLVPDQPFTYSFLDEQFNATYQTEQKTGLMLGIFAALTIFVACLGLFGLAMFTAGQRTKEIGVRKVLGASVTSIVALLSRDFLKLVLIAGIIVTPVAWWAMSRWLQDFAYRIEIAWWMVAGAGLLAVAIALLTVSFQSVKAALMNPVKSLRSD